MYPLAQTLVETDLQISSIMYHACRENSINNNRLKPCNFTDVDDLRTAGRRTDCRGTENNLTSLCTFLSEVNELSRMGMAKTCIC